jgi:snRNA-activating protein complex (SNAPc), subunit 3
VARAPSAGSTVSVDEASRDLQLCWEAACTELAALPEHARFAQLPPYSAPQLLRRQPVQPGASALQQRKRAVQRAHVVVQVALQAPDAHFATLQTLLLRADSSLAELSDAIHCANNQHAHYELGHDLHGGMFYINGTMYVDTRSEGQHGHVDYAASLQKFFELRAAGLRRDVTSMLAKRGAQAPDPGAAPAAGGAKCMAMQDAKLCDLAVQVARSGLYLYLHAGACEHIVVFEDVRWHHPDDPDVVGRPARLPRRGARLEKCCTCAIKPAVMMAFDDALAPESPAFFCAQCYDDLHCDGSGALLPEAQEADVFDIYE